MNPSVIIAHWTVIQGPPVALPLAMTYVPAGFPSPAEDHLVGSIDLSMRFVPRPTTSTVMRCGGECLVGIGILPGDYLLVDRSRDPRDGDVVVATVNGENTAKRWRVRGEHIVLASENPNCPSIPWGEGCEVWGVVTSVHRDLSRIR